MWCVSILSSSKCDFGLFLHIHYILWRHCFLCFPFSFNIHHFIFKKKKIIIFLLFLILDLMYHDCLEENQIILIGSCGFLVAFMCHKDFDFYVSSSLWTWLLISLSCLGSSVCVLFKREIWKSQTSYKCLFLTSKFFGVGELWRRSLILLSGQLFVQIKRRVVWVLEAFLLSTGPFCASGVGTLRSKGSLCGGLSLVGRLRWKKESGVPVK